ncbi:MAG: hypothetical protein JSS56_22540 [Proteobacteria bacterium]|nr:hypothetical protein [Pseudomonadota bacterium]
MVDVLGPDKYSPELGDWRLMKTGWVTAIGDEQLETPKVFRGSTVFLPHGGNEFSFPSPSATALHLNAAWKAARRARAIKNRLSVHVFAAKNGQFTVQAPEGEIAALFDYFEEMIFIAFGSFGAVEAYCNQLIVESGVTQIRSKRKNGDIVMVPPEQAERDASTDEKLKRIVPDLLGIPTPSGKKVWEAYLRIKRKRDAVTHFKRHDQMRHADRAHEPTVLFDLYALDCFSLPEDAMEVLRYLQPGELQRWMKNPEWMRENGTAAVL